MSQLPTTLIRKYDKPGPRYTSYPTALEFHETFGPERFEQCLRENNVSDERPLSLYFHLPFCKQVCYFCGCNAIYTGRRERAQPYVEQLLREIDLIAAHVRSGRWVVQIHWGGGTPTFLAPELMERLHRATLAAFDISPDAEIGVEIDPREASDEHLQTLARLGFNRLSIGVQDFHPEVQKAVNRIQPYALTAAKLQRARELGFGSINVDLMYGLPLQTRERMLETLQLTLDLRPDRIAFFNYAYLPELKKHMRRINPNHIPPPEEKLAMLEAAVEQLTEAGYVYLGMDHFVLPGDELAVALREGRMQRNFQGYTTHAGAELYGLGVTAISDLGTAYAQNVKTEVQYAARMAEGRFATWRGVWLSQDDHLRRQVIMDIMSRFTVDLGKVATAYGVDAAHYFARELRALQEFEADGLITRDGLRLRVTESGRFLVRNVAMVFDAYLQHAPAQERRFSRTV